jgi:xanthine dehydrogenase molybdopterin-binding subunit B
MRPWRTRASSCRPKSITRGEPAEAIAAAPHRVKGRTTCGQQEQFYLEGQITYAVPREDGQLTLYVSTQHPDGNQREAAAALNLHTHDVEVICRRMGGGFGGKEGNCQHLQPERCAGGLQAEAAGQAARQPGRRHDHHRQASRFPHRLRGGL